MLGDCFCELNIYHIRSDNFLNRTFLQYFFKVGFNIKKKYFVQILHRKKYIQNSVILFLFYFMNLKEI